MKSFVKIFIASAIAMLALSFTSDAKSKWEKVIFLSEIHCESCVQKLEANLSYERGVKDLEISLETQTITFQFDPNKTTKEKLAQAISKLGYKAEEIQEIPECSDACGCGHEHEHGHSEK